ncbi:trehalose-phosphatase [Saccharomycopsis crataegensis]|uniref:Trehalose-phosphatase n=1 Tax=Saccharomycopsis crataegensis TaxID=43959 RepID=A0AAV5QEC4_9ASCO|nr:trehalose-phosphatase [Saccharomycopsis crataegensis]
MSQNPLAVDDEAVASPLASNVTPVIPGDSKAQQLKTSGRIIAVMTNLPNQVHLNRNTADNTVDFSLSHTRGNSSVYSSFYYLNQQTPWETHLVGWTGEVMSHTNNRLNRSDVQNDPLYLSDDDKSTITGMLKTANNSENVHPVWLLRRDQQRWRKYAENVLWPVFHYINQNTTFNSNNNEVEWWHDYVRFNEAYATKIMSIYKPGDIIWIHDYYLLLLPNLLRLQLPEAYIGLYLHTPFPSSEYFRCLSKRSNLLEGMLGANRIAFQSYSFAKHFVSSCSRILGCETTHDSITTYGRICKLEALPNGIDTSKIISDAFNEKIDKRVDTIKKVYANKKIIVGRDRLDSVRGVLQKLEAFEKFLIMYPEWRDKVVLIQVSSPVADMNKAYEKQVSEFVSYINGTYGTLHSNPVQHFQMRIDKDEYLALLRVADLGLITTIRDGMNTTALEFVACQMNNYSPLILSEFSGTTTVLSDAIVVNPWDSVGVAKTINDCLHMPVVQKVSLEKQLFKTVSINTNQYSTNKFLRHLIDDLGSSHECHSTPPLNRPKMLKSYNDATKRLFLFDYDGTLTPIVKDPDAAIPSARTLHLLTKLAKDPKNRIWIISGRDQQFLDEWLGSKISELGLSAEHGCFVRDVDSQKWINLTESIDMSWQKDVEDVFTYYTERTPGSFIERKKVALTWHYRKADPEYGEFQARELKQHLNATVAQNYDVEVMSGKANVEVRPRFVNKGEIVKKLTLSAHGEPQDFNSYGKKNLLKKLTSEVLPDFIFCVGDDKTDEDMFEALISIEEAWVNKNDDDNYKSQTLDGDDAAAIHDFGMYPVTVGPASKKTIAKAHLLEPKQVLDTLGLLVGEVSIFETGGSVTLDDRGHIKE